MGRTVSAVVTWGDAYLGVIGPFPVSVPWWAEVEPVVAHLREVLDVPVLVLRLLLADGGEGGRDGHVTYHVAALRRPAPGLLAGRPADQAAVTGPEELRSPWVAIDGIFAPYLDLRLTYSRDHDLELARELADGAGSCLGRARALAFGLHGSPAREQVLSTGRVISRALDQALEHARALDRVCAQGLAGRLGIATAEGLAKALADGVLDDFTSADLTCASLADADLSGVRWSLTGTAWPPGTDIRALLARSEAQPGGVLVFTHRGMMWQPDW